MRKQRNLIRAFLSSTFRDMTRERNHLNKVIFPEVRRITRARGVEFTAIDLRWGVTEEEANQGDVISICLEEIDRVLSKLSLQLIGSSKIQIIIDT